MSRFRPVKCRYCKTTPKFRKDKSRKEELSFYCRLKILFDFILSCKCPEDHFTFRVYENETINSKKIIYGMIKCWNDREAWRERRRQA